MSSSFCRCHCSICLFWNVCASRLRARAARPVCAPRLAPRLRAPSGAPSAETLKTTVFRRLGKRCRTLIFPGPETRLDPNLALCGVLGAQQPWPTRKEDKGSFHEPPAQQCKLTRTKGMGDRPGWLEGLGVEARDNLVFWNFRRERASKRDLPNPSSDM